MLAVTSFLNKSNILTVLYACLFLVFIQPFSLRIGDQGVSANYLFLLFPFLILFITKEITWPKKNIIFFIIFLSLIYIGGALFQTEHHDLFIRRSASFAAFMSVFALIFIKLDKNMIRAFKIALVIFSLYISFQVMAKYISADGNNIGFYAKGMFGSQRIGFIFLMGFWVLMLQKIENNFIKVIRFILLYVILVGIFTTFSRSSMVGLFGSIGAYFLHLTYVSYKDNNPYILIIKKILSEVIYFSVLLLFIGVFFRGTVTYYTVTIYDFIVSSVADVEEDDMLKLYTSWEVYEKEIGLSKMKRLEREKLLKDQEQVITQLDNKIELANQKMIQVIQEEKEVESINSKFKQDLKQIEVDILSLKITNSLDSKIIDKVTEITEINEKINKEVLENKKIIKAVIENNLIDLDNEENYQYLNKIDSLKNKIIKQEKILKKNDVNLNKLVKKSNISNKGIAAAKKIAILSVKKNIVEVELGESLKKLSALKIIEKDVELLVTKDQEENKVNKANLLEDQNETMTLEKKMENVQTAIAVFIENELFNEININSSMSESLDSIINQVSNSSEARNVEQELESALRDKARILAIENEMQYAVARAKNSLSTYRRNIPIVGDYEGSFLLASSPQAVKGILNSEPLSIQSVMNNFGGILSLYGEPSALDYLSQILPKLILKFPGATILLDKELNNLTATLTEKELVTYTQMVSQQDKVDAARVQKKLTLYRLISMELKKLLVETKMQIDNASVDNVASLNLKINEIDTLSILLEQKYTDLNVYFDSAVVTRMKDKGTSIGYRSYMHSLVFEETFKSPFTGSSFLGVWTLFENKEGSAHSQYLDILYRTGIIGLIWYLLYIFKISQFLLRNQQPLFFGFVGMLFVGLFHETIKLSQGAFIFAFLFAMWTQRYHLLKDFEEPS